MDESAESNFKGDTSAILSTLLISNGQNILGGFFIKLCNITNIHHSENRSGRTPHKATSPSLIDRVLTHSALEGKNKHPQQRKGSCFLKLFKTDRHTFMARLRLISISSSYAIPPRKIEAEIAVGFPRNDRVVNAVHVRSYNEKAQDSI